MRPIPPPELKPLDWIGPSRDEIRAFPDAVQDAVGHALLLAQAGEKSNIAKPLKGFGGAGVLEVVENHDGDTYRAVYTVKFAGVVYVLHCFQKKSKRGRETPNATVELIRRRLRQAEAEYEIRRRMEP